MYNPVIVYQAQFVCNLVPGNTKGARVILMLKIPQVFCMMTNIFIEYIIVMFEVFRLVFSVCMCGFLFFFGEICQFNSIQFIYSRSIVWHHSLVNEVEITKQSALRS